jgi:hypothetical protein
MGWGAGCEEDWLTTYLFGCGMGVRKGGRGDKHALLATWMLGSQWDGNIEGVDILRQQQNRT